MKANTDMDAAPKDRNILIKTIVMHYIGHGWRPDGFQWVEARWVEASGGRPARFAEWCGNPRTQSTDSLRPVAWAELPAEA